MKRRNFFKAIGASIAALSGGKLIAGPRKAPLGADCRILPNDETLTGEDEMLETIRGLPMGADPALHDPNHPFWTDPDNFHEWIEETLVPVTDDDIRWAQAEIKRLGLA